MGLKDLPVAKGARHVAAFEHAGWTCVRIRGSHHILEKDGVDPHLSVPCHARKDLSRKLLRGLIEDAGMTEEEYQDHFHKRVPKNAP
jgi:predicted RNA binding protein YcfA (HicA-like mRNA interferase family)